MLTEQDLSTLKRVSVYMVIVGVIFGSLAYIGPWFGVQFDGGSQWTVDTDRILLHIVPGTIIVAFGLLVAAFARSARARGGRVSDEARTGRLLTALTVGMALSAVWAGAGPWIADAAGLGHVALMFASIPHWNQFSPLHQLALEAGCHWIPGIFAFVGCLVAFRVLVRVRHRGEHVAVNIARA